MWNSLRATANAVGGIVNTTITHMVQSSHAAVLAPAGMREAKRARNTIRAMTPGTMPPTITEALLSRGGDGSHKASDAFFVSVECMLDRIRGIACHESGVRTELFRNLTSLENAFFKLRVEWHIGAKTCRVCQSTTRRRDKLCQACNLVH